MSNDFTKCTACAAKAGSPDDLCPECLERRAYRCSVFERILTIVYAFDDAGRRDAVRKLASDYAQEAATWKLSLTRVQSERDGFQMEAVAYKRERDVLQAQFNEVCAKGTSPKGES